MLSKRASKIPVAKVSDLSNSIQELISLPTSFEKLDKILLHTSAKYNDTNSLLLNNISRGRALIFISFICTTGLLYISYYHVRKWFPDN